MTKFVILLNGDVTVTERLRHQVSDGRVIAVDGGMRHAQTLKLVPERWIGDFDSSSKDLQQEWSQVQQMVHPVEKDKTDGALALEFALDCGADEIVLVGGLGGELDHSICHVSQLVWLARQNVASFATSGSEEAWPLVNGRFQRDFPVASTISIVGLTDLKDLCLNGVKWPLKCVDVTFGASLTMSNEVTGLVSGSLDGGYGVVLVKDII